MDDEAARVRVPDHVPHAPGEREPRGEIRERRDPPPPPAERAGHAHPGADGRYPRAVRVQPEPAREADRVDADQPGTVEGPRPLDALEPETRRVERVPRGRAAITVTAAPAASLRGRAQAVTTASAAETKSCRTKQPARSESLPVAAPGHARTVKRSLKRFGVASGRDSRTRGPLPRLS